MQAIPDVMLGGRWHEPFAKWRKMSVRYGAPQVARAIPIANLGQPNNWCYLDSGKLVSRTGEYVLVKSSPEDDEAFGDLMGFLENRKGLIQYELDINAGLIDESDDS